jgi:hypothetical protein
LQAAQLAHAKTIRRGQLARRHPELAEVLRAADEAAVRIAELDQQVADLTEINGRLNEQLEAAAKPKPKPAPRKKAS